MGTSEFSECEHGNVELICDECIEEGIKLIAQVIAEFRDVTILFDPAGNAVFF